MEQLYLSSHQFSSNNIYCFSDRKRKYRVLDKVLGACFPVYKIVFYENDKISGSFNVPKILETRRDLFFQSSLFFNRVRNFVSCRYLFSKDTFGSVKENRVYF